MQETKTYQNGDLSPTLQQASTAMPTHRSFPKNSIRDMKWTSPFVTRNTLKKMEEASDEGQHVTLNMTSLKQLLLTYGEYPAKYRTLIWRYILCLPENQGAYDVLSTKGVHPVQQDLYKRYPIENSVMFRKLEK
jgi:hypothetical protein